MATTPTKPDLDATSPSSGAGVPAWPDEQSASNTSDSFKSEAAKPSHRDALQALLAFSALHEQVRRRKAQATRHASFDAGAPPIAALKPEKLERTEFAQTEFEPDEQFVLDE